MKSAYANWSLPISRGLRSLREQRSVQGARDLIGNFVLKFGQASHIKVALPGEAGALQMCIEHLDGETPLSL